MKRLLLYAVLGLLPVILCFAGLSKSHAEVPHPYTVQAMAIYEASETATDDMPDPSVNYNVTDPITITNMLMGIEVDTLRDCEDLQAKNEIYVYVKFKDGTRKVYHLFSDLTHFSLVDDRGNCYYVPAALRWLYITHAQP